MKKVLIPVMAIAVAAFSGCSEEEDDHDHNHVTIMFDEPTDGAVIPLADAASVHIHVEFVYEEEGEEVEVRLYPEGDPSDLIIDHEQHGHDNPIVYTTNVDLSGYAPGTEFHLEVKACEDHDCEEFVEDDIHFSLES